MTIIRRAHCPVCGLQHGLSVAETVPGKPYIVLSRDNWWARARGRNGERPFGIIVETQGRATMKVVGYYEPSDGDPEGFFPLVKLRLIEAVQDWLAKGYVTLDDFTRPPPVVAPVPLPPLAPAPAAPSAPRAKKPPVTPVAVAPAPAPAPTPTPAIPAFEVPEEGGRRAAQGMIKHLQQLERLPAETPELETEFERLGDALERWLDTAQESLDEEESKDRPSEKRTERLEELVDALREGVDELQENDASGAIDALERAYPAPARKPAPGERLPAAASPEDLAKQAASFVPRIEQLKAAPTRQGLEKLEQDMDTYVARILAALEKAGGPEKAPGLQSLARRFEVTGRFLEQAKLSLARGAGLAYLRALESLKACCL